MRTTSQAEFLFVVNIIYVLLYNHTKIMMKCNQLPIQENYPAKGLKR